MINHELLKEELDSLIERKIYLLLELEKIDQENVNSTEHNYLLEEMNKFFTDMDNFEKRLTLFEIEFMIK